MTYRVAIAISGAVSLGSYEAGTLYEIIKALKEHNENPANPKIEIDVLTGASAGGMTAAMIAQKLLYDGDALSGENTNVGYEAWVKSVDINGLLTPLPGDNAKNSLLSNGFVKTIADKLINSRYVESSVPNSPPAQAETPLVQTPHIASATSIRLGLAMSNLNGVDYEVDTFAYLTETLGQGKFTQTRHQDRYTATLDNTTDNQAIWNEISSAARGCGAFPVAFSPVSLSRSWLHGDYSGRGAVKFEDSTFSFMDGGAFNNYPLGMAVSLAEQNDTNYTDYENRFYFYISPNPRESAANPEFDATTASFAQSAKQMLNSVYLQSGFQEWLLQEQDNEKVLRLDHQADTLREKLYSATSEEVFAEQAIIDSMIAVVYGGNTVEYAADIARLATQYRVDVAEKPLPPSHFKLWVDTIALLEHAAGLGPTNLKTIYTITAKKDELSGELLGAFLGFFDERFRQYDYERGRLNAMLTINGILDKQRDEGVIQKQLPLNIEKRDHHSIQQFLDSSHLNHASMADVKYENRELAYKRVKARFFAFTKDAGIASIARFFAWNFIVRKTVKKVLVL
jgi:predicted acylesterase/phospholipase RssA